MSRWGSEPAPSRGWGWQRPHGATPPTLGRSHIPSRVPAEPSTVRWGALGMAQRSHKPERRWTDGRMDSRTACPHLALFPRVLSPSSP